MGAGSTAQGSREDLLAPPGSLSGSEEPSGSSKDPKAPLLASHGALRALLSSSPPNDVVFSAALGTLLLLVTLREVLVMGPLALSALAKLPWAALGVLPALVVSSAFALVGCWALLCCVRGMTPHGLRVYALVFVVLLALLGILGLLGTTSEAAPAPAGVDVAPLLRFNVGNDLRVLLLAGFGLAALLACSEYHSSVATLIGNTATFLLTRGKLAVALVLAVGFVEGSLFILPVVSTGSALASDCSTAAVTAAAQAQALFNGTQAHPKPDLSDMLALLKPFEADAECKPWVTLLGEFGPSAVLFSLLSAFLFVWVLVLFRDVCIFLSCLLLRQAKLSAGDGKDSLDFKAALRDCFGNSFGSLCFASFLSSCIVVLHLVFEIFLLIPLLRVTAAASLLMPLEFLLYFSSLLFLSMLVVPGLATYRTSFWATCSQVVSLLSEKFLHVVSIPLLMLPVSTLLAVPLFLLVLFVEGFGLALMSPLIFPALLIPFLCVATFGPILQVTAFSDVFSSTVSCSFIAAPLGSQPGSDLEACLPMKA